MITKFKFIILLLFFIPVEGFGLSCEAIQSIQNRYLKTHITYSKITPQIKKRVLDQFLKHLDSEKIYFLRSDIKAIQKRATRLFANIKNNNCSDLYHIYNIYSKRVDERISFIRQYLKTFKFKKNLSYVTDEDQKRYPRSEFQANKAMEAYIQYQVANIFVTEDDLKKSTDYIFHIFRNISKQVQSWKPQLNPKEVRECLEKSKGSFQFCKPEKWLSLYLNSFAQSLDSHSSYLDREEMEDFNISMNLSLEGIGATLGSRFGYTVVERLVPGGAAFKSNKIKRKDKILAVGQSKNKMISIFGERIEDVVSIIRGKKGTAVYLKILRETDSKKSSKKNKKEIFVVKLIRDKVDLKEEAASIRYINKKVKNKNEKIGIIKVPSFYGSGRYGKSVTMDVRKLLRNANKKRISALVLDLSNNRGGSLDEAVNLAGLFFSTGNVVKQSEKNQFGNFKFKRSGPSSPNEILSLLKDRDQRIFYKGPLIVLINRLSASASEIVSGTLQDYNRAVVVGGDHTFGKGSVQSVEYMRNLGALKTTVGLYFIPSGKSTQNQGVSSDIPLPSIFNLDKIGEKTLDYALPSQTISSFKSPPEKIFNQNSQTNWKPIHSNIIKKLKFLSKNRVAKNQEFKKIVKRFKKIEKRSKNKKPIKISKILNDKEDEDDLEDELSTNDDDFFNPNEKEKRYLKRPDVQEAVSIASDLSNLNQNFIYKSFSNESKKNNQ